MGADLDVLCGPAEGGVAQLAGRSVGAGYPARPLGYFVAEADVPAHRCPPGGWLVSRHVVPPVQRPAAKTGPSMLREPGAAFPAESGRGL